MMRAYNELYVNDAKQNLGQCFSYLIDDCELDPDTAWSFFRNSGFAEKYERGDPWVISGMSGIELGERILAETYDSKSSNEIKRMTFNARETARSYQANFTPSFWAGWALAEYQWYTGRRFKDILSLVPLEEVISMYMPYHEMDIYHFIDAMDDLILKAIEEKDTKLKHIRENRGISQSELSDRSGVNLRSIQMYEQRQNDIDKAQGHTLYKLARVLGCDVEDLLEDPSM